MSEHRLIERMVAQVKGELERVEKDKVVDPKFIDLVVDFFRTYVDRCHHGKEEDILFRNLAGKRPSDEHRGIMNELIAEHVYARKTVSELMEANERHAQEGTDVLTEIQAILRRLTELYPAHIEKEDKHFFYPVMDYFNKQELDAMLQEFWEFDRKLIHEKYGGVVEGIRVPTRFKALPRWRCTICGYMYDPAVGDAVNGVKPGTPFEELPEDWRCPVCFAPKKEFEKVE